MDADHLSPPVSRRQSKLANVQRYRKSKTLRAQLDMAGQDQVSPEVNHLINNTQANGEFLVFKYNSKYMVSLIDGVNFIQLEQKFEQYLNKVDLLRNFSYSFCLYLHNLFRILKYLSRNILISN
jgi:hypothetical protein